MDETTQMVLGAIEKMNQKLDDLKDTLGRHTADTSAKLAGFEAWKLSTQESSSRFWNTTYPSMEERLRSLEKDRVTQAKLDALAAEVTALKESAAGKKKLDEIQVEVAALKEEKAAAKVKDRIMGVLGSAAVSGIVALALSLWKAAHP